MARVETDQDFRGRLMRVVHRGDRSKALVRAGEHLDDLGRTYGLFRTGIPLKLAAPRGEGQHD